MPNLEMASPQTQKDGVFVGVRVLMPGALQPWSRLRGDILITQTHAELTVPADRKTKDKVLSAFISLNTL